MKKLFGWRRSSLVEASLVLPVLLLTVFGGMIGYIMYTAKQAVTAAAVEAARTASVEPYDVDAARDAAARVVAAYLKVGSVESIGEATDAPPGALQGVLTKNEDGEFVLGGVRLDPKTGALRSKLESMVGKLIWAVGNLYERAPEPGQQTMAVVPHPGPYDTVVWYGALTGFYDWDFWSTKGMHVPPAGKWSWLWQRGQYWGWPTGALAKFVSPPIWLDRYGVYKVYANYGGVEVRVNDAITGAPGMEFDGVSVDWPVVFTVVVRNRYVSLGVADIGRHWDGTYAARSLGDGWYQYEWRPPNLGTITLTATDLDGVPLEVRVTHPWKGEIASGIGTVSFQQKWLYADPYQIKVKSRSPYNDVRIVFTALTFVGRIVYRTSDNTTGWAYYPVPGIEYVGSTVIPKRVAPGATFDVNMAVRNISGIFWGKYLSWYGPPVRFVYRFIAEDGAVISTGKVQLPKDMPSGEQADLKFTVLAPEVTGRLKLVIEGKQEDDPSSAMYGIEFGTGGLRWPTLEALLTVVAREKILEVTDAGEITRKERVSAHVTTFDPDTDVDVQVAGDTVTAVVRYRVPVLFPIFNLVGYHLSWGPEIPVTGRAALRKEQPAF